MNKRLAVTACLATVLMAMGAERQPAWAGDPCVGDCPPLDQRVTVTELILGVDIVLGSASVDQCPSYGVDGHADVSALIAAVNNALNGCPGGPTPLPSPTPTPTILASSPSATATVAPGPIVAFFGVTNADGTLQQPTPGPIPIFARLFGSGFQLVVEALPGASQRSVANDTEASSGPPDLQIQATNALGNGSPAVCDDMAPNLGGVPGIAPPNLGDPDAIADQLNDFGCRFVNGKGVPVSRSCDESCIRFTDGSFACESSQHAVQFCAAIDTALRFPVGDTLVTVRVRDGDGNLGPPAQLIVRIANP